MQPNTRAVLVGLIILVVVFAAGMSGQFLQ
jgi:hypothetical protein